MARTRPHVKIHLSIADHRKTAEVWSDLSMRGMLAELLRKGAEKYAARRDNWVPLKATDRMEIACDTDSSRADLAVRSLCKRLGYTVRTHSNRWEVQIRKFANKQGFEDKELQTMSAHERQELQPPNPNPIPKQKQIPKQSILESAPAAPTAKRSRAKTPCPDELEPDQRAAIRAWVVTEGIPPEVDLRREWAAMRDHWRAVGEQRADWPASFRTWLRRSVKFAARERATATRESTAQARERRLKESAIEAFRRGEAADGRTDSPPLLALAGGLS